MTEEQVNQTLKEVVGKLVALVTLLPEDYPVSKEDKIKEATQTLVNIIS